MVTCETELRLFSSHFDGWSWRCDISMRLVESPLFFYFYPEYLIPFIVLILKLSIDIAWRSWSILKWQTQQPPIKKLYQCFTVYYVYSSQFLQLVKIWRWRQHPFQEQQFVASGACATLRQRWRLLVSPLEPGGRRGPGWTCESMNSSRTSKSRVEHGNSEFV